MKRIVRWVAVVAGLSFLVGCGKQIPGGIIPPEKMEKVLYDYHLSVSMTNNLEYSEYYKKKSYNDYVFQKHGVTEEEFDSSMVWYTRHVDELTTIYSNLSERFKKDKQRIDAVLEAREATDFVSLPGDTVEAWPYRKLYWLASTPLNNLVTFTIEPDTNYHPKDAFLWKANYTFLAEGKAAMAFNILYDNDSVIGQSKLIASSGMDSLYLYTDSAYNIKSINAFIYLMPDSSGISSMLVNELSLTKYHAPKDSTQVVTDSLSDMKPMVKTEFHNPETPKPVSPKNTPKKTEIKSGKLEKKDVSLKLEIPVQ